MGKLFHLKNEHEINLQVKNYLQQGNYVKVYIIVLIITNNNINNNTSNCNIIYCKSGQKKLLTFCSLGCTEWFFLRCNQVFMLDSLVTKQNPPRSTLTNKQFIIINLTLVVFSGSNHFKCNIINDNNWKGWSSSLSL